MVWKLRSSLHTSCFFALQVYSPKPLLVSHYSPLCYLNQNSILALSFVILPSREVLWPSTWCENLISWMAVFTNSLCLSVVQELNPWTDEFLRFLIARLLLLSNGIPHSNFSRDSLGNGGAKKKRDIVSESLNCVSYMYCAVFSVYFWVLKKDSWGFASNPNWFFPFPQLCDKHSNDTKRFQGKLTSQVTALSKACKFPRPLFPPFKTGFFSSEL